MKNLRSQANQQIILLENSFHRLCASSLLKIASNMLRVKCWITKT